MTSVLKVGDLNGQLLAELSINIESVYWRLNNVGRVKASIARSSSKATQKNLRLGNRAMLEFDNGLPAFGGVIDTPREWKDDLIRFTILSGEAILSFMQTDKGRYFTAATLAEIVASIVQEGNQVSQTGILIGELWDGGGLYSPDYHFEDGLSILRDSVTGTLSDSDFDVTVEESAGRLNFKLNLYERKGIKKQNIVFNEGVNAKNIELREQGTITNYWAVVGQGQGWGEDRPVAYAFNQDSADTYGYRPGRRIDANVVSEVTLQNNAFKLLAERKQPSKVYRFDSLNLAPATFGSYDVGDIVRAIFPSYGFGGTDEFLRVVSREYLPRHGFCRLVVDNVGPVFDFIARQG